MLGCEHLASGMGGIAAVSRMTALSMQENGYDIDMLSYLDDEPVEIASKSSKSAQGNRLKFVWNCHLAALDKNSFVYSSVGTARAHPRFWPLNKPYAVWIHGTDVWHNLHKGREQALRSANLVLVNSQFTLDKFEEIHWKLDNAKVCHLGTFQSTFPNELAPPEGPPTALILSRIDLGEGKKGHSELIDCWSQVIMSIPNARLVIAGGGNGVEAIREYARKSAASNNIDVVGFVPDEKLSQMWRTANVFAMPSRQEGFGIVYAEAMRHGLPVIASVHDAGQEVNEHGVTGYNVNLDDPSDLPAQLIKLLGSADLSNKLGKAAQKRWFEMYRFDSFSSRLNQILDAFPYR